jgi:DNA-binding MarR family transcriptional regulator
MSISSKQCAIELLEAVPLIMRSIRSKMRELRDSDTSVPQFRILAYIGRHNGVSLSDVANHIGITPPSASKIVDDLVSKKLAKRKINARDRRHIILALTPTGKAKMLKVRKTARAHLAGKLNAIPSSKRRVFIESMQILHKIFTSEKLRPAQNGRYCSH